MLRGLDTGGTGSYEPPIITVTDRVPTPEEVAVYVRRPVRPADRPLVREALETARLLRTAPTGERVRIPDVRTEGEEPTDARRTRRAASAAVGEPVRSPLESVGDERFTPVCIAIRRSGSLVGYYPRPTGEEPQTVRDGLSALSAGDDLENLP